VAWGGVQHGRPGRFDRGGKRYEHVLDGDGHLIKFVVDGKRQRAHISNAYVKTDEFMAEEAKDDILYRSTFGTQPRGLMHNFMNLHLKNQANTNIQFCGGSLLALWEAGLPWQVNPWTLETLGVASIDACVRGQPGALTVTTGFVPCSRPAAMRRPTWPGP
jgi:all-trans-8'-apo-beta-carotenal 15,15'-oxygenase